MNTLVCRLAPEKCNTWVSRMVLETKVLIFVGSLKLLLLWFTKIFEYPGLQKKLNTQVLMLAPKLYHIILGLSRPAGVTNCNNGRRLLQLFFEHGRKKSGFWGYNSRMDKKALLNHIKRETVMIWDSLCEIYTPLVHYNEPKVQLNPYIWRCAGQCFQSENRIQMGYKFFKAKPEYFNHMMDVILPHEIIHQADWNLFGESEKICGHGTKWREMMVQYGLKANPYHTMEISKNA